MESLLTQITNYLHAQSWQIAVLTIVIVFISFLFKNKSAHIRYILWMIVLAKCLVPPFYTISLAVLPPQEIPVRTLSQPTVENMITEYSVPELTLTELSDSMPNRSEIIPPLISKEKKVNYNTRSLLAIGWLAGLIALSLYYIINALRTQIWLHNRRKELPSEYRKNIENLFIAHGYKKTPHIWMLDEISQPFVWGLVRGSIYLPTEMTNKKNARFHMSLLGHELSHIIRFDALINSLQIVAQAIFWFHPFVWWTNRKIRMEREKCCDEMTISSLNTIPEDYSDAIVEILATKYEQARRVPSLAVAGKAKNIEERIKTMLRPGKKFYKRPSVIALIIILLFAFLIVPIGCVLTNKSETKTVTEQAENTPKSLFEAIWASDPDEVKRLIANGVDVNTTDPDNPDVKYTPLMAAANGGFAKVAKVLLENGAEVNATDFQGWTALYYAFWLYSPDDNEKKHRERAELVKALITSGADVNKQCQGISPLINAITTGTPRLGSIEALLDGGADIHFKDNRGLTPLYYAAFDGDRNVLDLIIERGDYADTIHLAACRGDLDKVQTLLEKGTDVNTKDEFGCTPLHWAVRARSPEVASLLITNGADINATAGPDNLTPLMTARKLPVIELLVSKGVDVRSQENKSKLYKACSVGDIKVVRFLIDKGADVNARNSRRSTPLCVAAASDHKEVVELLLDKGADINAPGRRGYTPLGSAARYGSKETAEFLIEKGANIHTPDNRGMSPLDLAKEWGWTEIVELLTQHGAKEFAQVTSSRSTRSESQGRMSSIERAILSNNLDKVKELISQGADVNLRDSRGNTPLLQAIIIRKLSFIEPLIAAGADVNVKARNGAMPLHRIANSGQTEIAELLIKNGANVDAREERWGSTPLLAAAVSGRKDMVELLLKKGADIESPDGNGLSPLHLTAGYGNKVHMNVIQLLIKKGADINSRGYGDATPFQTAVAVGRKEVAELLLIHGAKVNVVGKYWGNAAHCAMRINKPEMVRWAIEKGIDIPLLHQAAYFGETAKVRSLLNAGEDVNQKDQADFTPLHCAVFGTKRDVVELLLKNSANIEARSCGYVTPLFWACKRGHLDMVKVLLENGAQVNGRSRKNMTWGSILIENWIGLHAAAQMGHLDVVEYLLAHGADINAECTVRENGITPLHCAARGGHVDVIKFLLAKGVDINHRTVKGRSALDIAKEHYHTKAVELLRKYGAKELRTPAIWMDTASDHLWSTSKNWSKYPTATDWAKIRNGLPGPTIDFEGAVANRVHIGYPEGGILTIDGGTLVISEDDLRLGKAGNTGTLNMISGSISVARDLDVGSEGQRGIITMTGGTITVSRDLEMPASVGSSAQVNLYGGTIILGGSLLMREDGILDITAGTLIIDGDARVYIQGYMNNGWITAYGGTGTIIYDYDTSHSGKTTISASPDVAYITVPDVIGADPYLISDTGRTPVEITQAMDFENLSELLKSHGRGVQK